MENQMDQALVSALVLKLLDWPFLAFLVVVIAINDLEMN
jgi:hypothetical protein